MPAGVSGVALMMMDAGGFKGNRVGGRARDFSFKGTMAQAVGVTW